jgi:hypothetical protein
MKGRKASFRRNYPLKRVFFFVFLKCFVICGFAQDLSTFSLQFGQVKNGFSTANWVLGKSIFRSPDFGEDLNHIRAYKLNADSSLDGLASLIWFENSYLGEKGRIEENVFRVNPNNASSLQPAWINPDPGYLSYLCRKELEIEKKSPIPFWFQIGENDPALLRHQRGGAVSTVNLKFKLAN